MIIFKNIKTTNKISVEIGVSNVSSNVIFENNTMNLLTKGWKSYWFDCTNIKIVPENCIFTKIMLTADNVVQVFESLNIPKQFDLLSIDIDGNDYHIRQALREYKPRVCIMEYNGCFNGNDEYIMKRNDNYMWKPGQRDFGASLKSITNQANELGYDLIYCESKGVNAFYIKKDINKFNVLTSEEAYVKLCWS
jgi:hypothetical protein